jgi:hypothetical protein
MAVSRASWTPAARSRSTSHPAEVRYASRRRSRIALCGAVLATVVLDREPDERVGEVEPVGPERVLQLGGRQAVAVYCDTDAGLHG